MITGQYRYRIYNVYTGVYSHYLEVKVEIVKESNTQYKIRYIGQPLNGRTPGSVSWVKKHNVKPDRPLKVRKVVGEVRLPYID